MHPLVAGLEGKKSELDLWGSFDQVLGLGAPYIVIVVGASFMNSINLFPYHPA